MINKNINSKLGKGTLSYNKEFFGKSPKEILISEMETASLQVGGMSYTLSFDTLGFSIEESLENDFFFEVVIYKSGEYIGHSHPFYSKVEDENSLIKIFESGVLYNATDEDDY